MEKTVMLNPNKALFIWTLGLIVVVGVLPFNKLWLLIFLAAFTLIFLCLWLVQDSTIQGVGGSPDIIPDETEQLVFEPLHV